MNKGPGIIERGVSFIRDNPQIIFTLTLLVVIPVAFLYASEQFLSLARDNQDRLERGRVDVLEDAVASFAVDHLNDPSYLDRKLQEIAEENPTLRSFRVIQATSSGYSVTASAIEEERQQIIQLDDLTKTVIGLAVARPGQPISNEIYLSGDRYWRTARTLQDGGGNVIAVLVSDVSMAEADRLVNKEIQNAYVTLIVIIMAILILLARQARIIDYATLYRRLKQVDQMKDDFVSMAAHELRSPLAIIRGYIEMIGEEHSISDAGRSLLKRTDEAADNLSSLIGDILDVAKLQQGRMSFDLEKIAPAPLIKEAVESFQRLAADKGLSLVYDAQDVPYILMDRTRFHQVIVNLIGNAIKYTPSGEVRIATNASKAGLEIRVSDSGMGISAEDQRRLFEKFYRVKNSETAKITGTGLGLWITREIVRAMNGEVSVESIKGKGSDFILRFPVVG